MQQGSVADRTDMHQPQHSKDKDMLHLNTTPREPPWKFYFFQNLLEPHHYGTTRIFPKKKAN